MKDKIKAQILFKITEVQKYRYTEVSEVAFHNFDIRLLRLKAATAMR